MYIKEAEANPGHFLMYDSCCEELEEAFEDRYFFYDNEKEPYRFGAGYSHWFNYCPFCGKEIKLD